MAMYFGEWCIKQPIEMDKELNMRNRIAITGIVLLIIWSLLLWDHFHGGVPTHYIMQSDDLPGISNWWGGVAVPLAAWIVLYRITIRSRETSTLNQYSNKVHVLYRFAAGVMFGIGLSYFFSAGSNVTDYMMLSLFAAALFTPLYLGEYLLGFMIGTVYTLGGVLPLLFGSVLMILFLLLYKGPRFVFSLFKSDE